AEPARQVGTVGQLNVSPNAPNVVPGMVKMTVELRDLSSDQIETLGKQVEARAREIATRTRTEISMKLASQHEGALATPAVQTSIEVAAKKVGLATRRLPSGAGHDAQMM